MKWNFPASVAIGFVLVLGTASGLRLFGQQNPNGNGPDRPNNSGPQLYGQVPSGPQQARYQSGNDGFSGFNPAQQVWSPTSPPFGSGQRMVPYSYTTRTPDGQTVTSTVMRPEAEVNRLHAGHQVLRDTQAKLRSPDSTDSDKKEARESISKYLKEEFERDQNTRREQVERLEEQVAKLRKQLDKRQESQSKIIELRMQLLENDAEGLAFPEAFNDLNGPSNWPHPYAPYSVPPAIAPYPSYGPIQPTSPYYTSPQTQYGPSLNSGYPQMQPGTIVPQQKSIPPKEIQTGKLN